MGLLPATYSCGRIPRNLPMRLRSYFIFSKHWDLAADRFLISPAIGFRVLYMSPYPVGYPAKCSYEASEDLRGWRLIRSPSHFRNQRSVAHGLERRPQSYRTTRRCLSPYIILMAIPNLRTRNLQQISPRNCSSLFEHNGRHVERAGDRAGAIGG